MTYSVIVGNIVWLKTQLIILKLFFYILIFMLIILLMYTINKIYKEQKQKKKSMKTEIIKNNKGNIKKVIYDLFILLSVIYIVSKNCIFAELTFFNIFGIILTICVIFLYIILKF